MDEAEFLIEVNRGGRFSVGQQVQPFRTKPFGARNHCLKQEFPSLAAPCALEHTHLRQFVLARCGLEQRAGAHHPLSGDLDEQDVTSPVDDP